MRETGEPKAVALDETARKEILFLSSCVVDFRSLVRALISGPKVKTGERRNYVHHDGRTGDVYLTIMRAIAMDPPKLAIPYAELQERLDKMTQGRVARRCERRQRVHADLARSRRASRRRPGPRSSGTSMRRRS